MIDELEKKIAWQNINTSEEKNKILSGKAIAIESEKIKLTHEDGKIYEFYRYHVKEFVLETGDN